MQLNHYNTNFKQRTFPIILVCDNVTNSSNIGSLFRIADAFGIEKVIFCGETIPLGRKMTKTSRATEKVVTFEAYESVSKVVSALKKQNYTIISLEITSKSLPIHTFPFSKEKPIALIVGDENFGISEEVLKLSDTVIHINMFGKNSSMNVVQATNIALYEITKQLI
ncbi:MAG: TrmH family RNA methyltransferase [Flavobacteriaceae bacterium]|nr:TrmH family RNA methyltransferase [Flavobacteriaceae bacterium]